MANLELKYNIAINNIINTNTNSMYICTVRYASVKYAYIKAFLYFQTKSTLYMTNFTMDKSKTDKPNFGKSNRFCLFDSDI